MEETDSEKRVEGPMSDGEYIRNADYKQFDPENDDENVDGSRLISEMLRLEYMRDFKLEPSSVAMNNVPRCDFPFNRHTVTVGVGNVVVDFDTARKQHEKIKAEQMKFAEEIEKVKEEMEKVRIIEKSWFDDYLNNKYINDLSAELNGNIPRGIGDACVQAQEPFTEKIRKQTDTQGILHVRDVADHGAESSSATVKPRGRYIVPYRESVASLPNVSV